jgi:hypothetical protein
LNPFDALDGFATGAAALRSFFLPIAAHCIVFAGWAGWGYSR